MTFNQLNTVTITALPFSVAKVILQVLKVLYWMYVLISLCPKPYIPEYFA